MGRRVSLLALLLVVVALGCSGGCRREVWRGPGSLEGSGGGTFDRSEAKAVVDPGPTPPPAQGGHPRLWIRGEDLPRLQTWARSPNGVYARTLRPLVEKMRRMMDRNEELFGKPTCADASGSDTCESYAMLFAFASLVAPSEGERRDAADRSRRLLMRVISEAAKGADPKAESWRVLRSAKFSTDDRSRWSGEAFGLTVDWIYPHLTADDKQAIRKVFLRWCDENVHATITDHNHPEPVGAVNDPALVKDPGVVRFAGNNYYTAHLRNLGLMAMALDPADDPDGKLRGYLRNATGAWLYVVDHLLKHDAKGGIGPEGYEYGPQTLSYVFELLLALHTAGEAVPARWGKQAALADDVFWDDAILAFFHAQSPATVEHPWMGPVYQPVWFGDGQSYHTADFIDLFGSIGVHAYLTGKTKRLELTRFLQKEYPPGGSKQWPQRLENIVHPRSAILYFLLFEPDAPLPKDPRPTLPLTFFSPGLGHLYARTSWGTDASFFQSNLGWISIDHQCADGGSFGFYRKGEWLTKHRVGYGNVICTSEWHNTLALENKKPGHADEDDYRYLIWKRGSQWFNGITDGDPTILARSEGPSFVYFHGDATNLFNSAYERSMDIAHASRATVWLKPDVVVVYDRASSKVDRRFKRFWMQLAEPAVVTGNLATMTSKKGQKLYVTKVLPKGGSLVALPMEPFKEETADLEPMTARLKTEAPLDERDVRFLHVVEGSSGAVTPTALVQSQSGAAFDGVVVGETAVLFPRSAAERGTDLAYTVPASVKAHLVTGLPKDTSFDVDVTRSGSDTLVRVRRGSKKKTDGGGVLSF